MNLGYSNDDVRQTLKPRDAWWTVLLVDPLATPLVKVTANRTSITPNQLTFVAAFLGIGAACAFWVAGTWGLVIGAVLFHLSFVIDCMDGKIARLKGTGSPFGVWLDFLFDRVRDVLCAVALFGAQYRDTGQIAYLWTALAFVAVNMFRYLNASQMAKVRTGMKRALRNACLDRGVDPDRFLLGGNAFGGDELDDDAGEVDLPAEPVTEATSPAASPAATSATETPRVDAVSDALQSGFTGRIPRYREVRDLLLRHRIRLHLFSGIELQMTTLIVGPLLQAAWAGSLLVVGWTAMGLTLAFEALLVVKLWASTRDFARVMARIQSR